MQVIGKTSEGRNLVVVTVGNNRKSAYIISIIYILDKSDRYIIYISVHVDRMGNIFCVFKQATTKDRAYSSKGESTPGGFCSLVLVSPVE